MSKPKIIILTSRKWNEWIANDSEIRNISEPKLIASIEEFKLEALVEFEPEFIFVPHWSFVIPGAIFSKFRTVIFHMTDLPYGRGGSPLQNLIQRGQAKTKISAIECGEGLDTGAVYCKQDLDLYGSAEEIFLRASKVIRSMIVKILVERMEPIPQRGEVTEFKRRKPDESDLTGKKWENGTELYDFIRMLDAPGYPKAFIDLGEFRIELSEVFIKQEGLKGTFEIRKKIL
ncbi:formyl transferase domain protein [Leptospira inadai serovar Lyme str. 10]|uniref:Formyl transferase domain protein n=2 Tax=Leptospira inadai serovar Lyme TaxID=293084 RepID=V6HBC3_9LEPT|nr:formyltransferase family protein [Leptospira inadai]EQA36702.1 formyl transferase domain protein [Leptospira inadai serovar Lyme str. 10]PNV76504.1 methionyl-tRNA formyltransferase [Leptospira inadai serovar Lyme]